MKQIQFGDEATQASVAKELNTYIVEQAWFAPFYRVQGSVATDANTTVEMLPTNAYPAIYDFRRSPRQAIPGPPDSSGGRAGPLYFPRLERSMLTFIIRRVLAGVVLLFVISVLAFGLLYLDSANIARRILGQNATAEAVAQKAEGARPRSARRRAVLGLAHQRPHRRPRPIVVQRSARDRQPHGPRRRHPLARDRHDARHRDRLGHPRRPRRSPRRRGRRHACSSSPCSASRSPASSSPCTWC